MLVYYNSVTSETSEQVQHMFKPKMRWKLGLYRLEGLLVIVIVIVMQGDTIVAASPRMKVRHVSMAISHYRSGDILSTM